MIERRIKDKIVLTAVSIALAVVVASFAASFITAAAGDLTGRLESISQQEANQ